MNENEKTPVLFLAYCWNIYKFSLIDQNVANTPKPNNILQQSKSDFCLSFLIFLLTHVMLRHAEKLAHKVCKFASAGKPVYGSDLST